MSDLAWSGLVRLGLSHLRLDPDTFWSLTPVELMLMAGLDGPSSSMTRDRLTALAAAFPDERDGGLDGGNG